MSNLAYKLVDNCHEVSGSFTGCEFVLHCLLLPACFNNKGVDVISRMDTYNEKPPSFLHIPVDGSGLPLPSLKLI